MGILSFITGIFKPAVDLVDSLVTTDEEKRSLHNQLLQIENAFSAQVLEYEQKMAQMKADIIMTEAKGESWLQKSWRPVTMLTFLCLITMHYFGILAFPIADDMWKLLQIGIGGYIVSRGAEKVLPAITDKFKKG